MSCRTVFDLDADRKEAEKLEEITTKQDFWSREDAQEISMQLAAIRNRIYENDAILEEFQELQLLAEMLEEQEDEDLQEEFGKRSEALEKKVEAKKLSLLLNGEHDGSNAIMTIHPGAGGLDSQDWAEMLYRMYLRWAEKHDYRIKILDLIQDEEAGIKTVTIMIKGHNATGFLKSERGVHRLVRISPFDTAKRRHTSFTSVDVSPEIPDDVEVDIRTEDLKIDTFRSSGAGGQHVNMTDSAVRITHLPSGVVVSCQNERSQHMNKQVAMQVLRSRLYDKAMKKRQEEINSLHGEKKEISWGSQIRSYVLHPYTMVKDHRTGEEVGNVQAVLDGNIDPFIMAYLKWKQ
jgi:peptide chain release factor 2